MACFLDTNILLYAKSRNTTEFFKRQIAEKLLDRRDCVLSVQVLQEFYVQATRLSRPERFSHEDAVGLIHSWTRFVIQPQTLDLLNLAFVLHDRLRFSYWDCAIIAAALVNDCDTLYTEDLQHDQRIDGLTIVNPFVQQ